MFWRFKMKMVKSLLLGSAAGLVAVAGAQAADLPVKAKPVQYVKICSLYGAGFYYIPGTDMCLKVGGYVRMQQAYGVNGNQTTGALVANLNNRVTNDYSWRARGYITADARSQSEYGTIRSYVAVGYSGDNNITLSVNRGFVQFAGFTFGVAVSAFDFTTFPAVAYWGGSILPNNETGDAGKMVVMYTAQFGNGLSASISAEASRNSWGTIGQVPSTLTSTTLTPSPEGQKWPDVVANLRIDQAWGSAQVHGAIHDASGMYYTTTDGPHPGDVIGWAAGAGVRFNLPMLGARDYMFVHGVYSQGAVGYVTTGTNMYSKYNGGLGGSYGYGLIADGVYGTTGSVQLTTAWGIGGAYEHNWTNHWKTSIYGGYNSFGYNSDADAAICAKTGVFSVAVTPAAGCSNSFSYWAVGTRTQWTVNNGLYLGLDVVYQKLNTASKGVVASVAGSGTQPTASRTIDDMDAVMVQFRVHRDF
jgi:hypothetical protein